MIHDSPGRWLIGLGCSGTASHSLCLPLYYSEGRLCHVTEELSSLTFALHFCFVPDGPGRAHASVPQRGGGGAAIREHRVPGGAAVGTDGVRGDTESGDAAVPGA